MGILEPETLDLDQPSSEAHAIPACCVGDILSARYRLDEEIGRGRMGIVFRGWDVELERPVAVEVLAAELEVGDARERLFREARAAAALNHPHVVAVHAAVGCFSVPPRNHSQRPSLCWADSM